MARNTFTFDKESAREILEIETEVSRESKERKELGEDIGLKKIRQYSVFAAAIWSLPTRAGKLAASNSKMVKASFTAETGLPSDKGVGKRLYDGAVALSAQREKLGIPTQATAGAIEAVLIQKQLLNESKLKAALFPSAARSDIEKVVAMFVGSVRYAKDENGKRVVNSWSTSKRIDQFDELVEALHNAKRIADVVAENAEREVSDQQTIAEILATVNGN